MVADKPDIIDPTKNVRELVLAESKYQDAMRIAEAKYQNGMRLAEADKQAALADMKHRHDALLFSINADAVKTTSDLISTQLTKVTDSLSNQIAALTKSFGDQLNAAINTLSDRLREQERFRYEQAGKTSVTDPAMADALRTISKLMESTKVGEGRDAGISRVGTIVLGVCVVISALVAIGGLIATVYFIRGGH